VLDDLPLLRFERGLVLVLLFVFAAVTGLRRLGRLCHAWLVGLAVGAKWEDTLPGLGRGRNPHLNAWEVTSMTIRRSMRAEVPPVQVDQNEADIGLRPAYRSIKPPVPALRARYVWKTRRPLEL
jgi:hypothetical protein